MINHGCLGANKKDFSPFLELLQKMSIKVFFNKDIEMSYDMLY
jgi:hypothetical protein